MHAPTAIPELGAPLATDVSLLSPEMGARLARLRLLARRAAEARRRGRRTTRRLGSGSDVRDTRPYVPGDDPRRIAWSAFARLERLVIWLTADEAPLRLVLVVDTSASMGFGTPSKLRQASRVAAGLAAVALSGGDRVAVVGASAEGLSAVRAVSGSNGLVRVLGALEALSPSGGTSLAAALTGAASVAGGRALCVILSDLLDPAGALHAVRMARARGHQAAIVHVLDPFELDPPELDGLDLEDEETGEVVAMPEIGATAAYLRALEAYMEEIDRGAAELGATVLRVSTQDAFETIVMNALRSRLLGSGGSQ